MKYYILSENDYFVSSSNSSEIGHVGNGTHRESLVNQSIVDKHVGHPKHRDSEALFRVFKGYFRQFHIILNFN